MILAEQKPASDRVIAAVIFLVRFWIQPKMNTIVDRPASMTVTNVLIGEKGGPLVVLRINRNLTEGGLSWRRVPMRGYAVIARSDRTASTLGHTRAYAGQRPGLLR